MFGKRVVPLFLMMALFVVTSCATSTQGKLFQAGAVSKMSAETAYQAIYFAYKQGKVSDVDMQKADMAFDQWSNAQKAYVYAAMDGKLTQDIMTAVETSLGILQEIAKSYGLAYM